eukprot:gene10346-13124_t
MSSYSVDERKAAMFRVREYLKSVIDEREGGDGEDLLTRVAGWRQNPRFESDEETLSMAMLLFVGGLLAYTPCLRQPHALWLLLVIAALALLDGLRQGVVAGRWPGITRLWAGRERVDLNVTIKPPRVRWRFWLGLAFMVVALAGPRWGFVDVPVGEQPKEVMIALDLSRSMLARDVKPSRLDHSKLLIQGLLDKLAGERVGLVLFA